MESDVIKAGAGGIVGIATLLFLQFIAPYVIPWLAKHFDPETLVKRQQLLDERAHRRQELVSEIENQVWARVQEHMQQQDKEIVSLRAEVADLTTEVSRLRRENAELRANQPPKRSRGLHP